MPVQWVVELARVPQRPLVRRFDVLHALACSVFEGPGSDHGGGEKGFTVRADRHDEQRLTLTWLGEACPSADVPEILQVGDELIPVAASRRTEIGYEEFDSASAVVDIALTVHTPALFRHNGHNYPLPDPYVMFSSLARRYRSHHPDAGFTDDVIRELGRSVMVTEHRVQTERFSWHGRTDLGFTGRIGFRLASRTDREIRRAYTVLGCFVGIAGIGRGTTHGLGATTTNCGPVAETGRQTTRISKI